MESIFDRAGIDFESQPFDNEDTIEMTVMVNSWSPVNEIWFDFDKKGNLKRCGVFIPKPD